MQELFEKIQEVQETKATEVTLSYLEIYNETIRDLLVEDGTKTTLMLREDANQTVSVAGLSSHRPQSVSENKRRLWIHTDISIGPGSHGYHCSGQRAKDHVADRGQRHLLTIARRPPD